MRREASTAPIARAKEPNSTMSAWPKPKTAYTPRSSPLGDRSTQQLQHGQSLITTGGMGMHHKLFPVDSVSIAMLAFDPPTHTLAIVDQHLSLYLTPLSTLHARFSPTDVDFVAFPVTPSCQPEVAANTHPISKHIE